LLKWPFVLLAVLIPVVVPAAFEVDNLVDTEIGAPILDVTTKPSEDLVFVLTPGEVLIYSADARKVIERIPVDKAFEKIAYQEDDRLVLTAGASSQMKILAYSRVYAIDTTGRALKGPADARVTLVVFDDYQ
jgi:hypothetical protein